MELLPKNCFKSQAIEWLAIVYSVTGLLRYVVLFMCLLSRKPYRLIYPLVIIAAFSRLPILLVLSKDRFDFDTILTIMSIVPLIFFSTLPVTLPLMLISNIAIIYGVVPVFANIPIDGRFHMNALAILVVMSYVLSKYDQLLVYIFWSDIKLKLSNQEYRQVVNTSKQGILIYAKESGRLLL